MLRRPLDRRLAGATSLAFALSLAAAAHHRAAVAHGYCSEHGRQVHLEHSRGGAEQGAPTLGRSVVERDHHVAGAHDCAQLAFLVQPCSLRQARLALGVRRHTPPGPARQPAPHVTGIPLLHLSPKHSPPA